MLSPSDAESASFSAFARRARAEPDRTLIALDVDGTVSEIASTPQEAHVDDDVRRTIERLADRYQVWFLSGRDADAARELVGVQRAGYIGAHGLEVLDGEGLRPLFDASGRAATLDRLAAAVAAEVPEVEPYIERKRWSVAFHYRASPDMAPRLRKSIESRLEAGLQLRSGKMVYEVMPAVERDKGTALRWLLAAQRPRHVFVAGDDETDLAMFRALAAEDVDGLRVAVVHEQETPAGLVEGADLSVAGVQGLRRLLEELLGQGP